MKLTRVLGAVLLTSAISLGIVGCDNAKGNEHRNTNPKLGWVKVDTYYSISKKCDGPNLMYRKYDDGLSIVPNSPECK
jgi:hypothetical protein